MMHCPFCARNLPDDAAFCYSCGARIEAVRPARGVAAGATLAGIGGPAALSTGPYQSALGTPAPADSAGRNTLLSPGGVPGFVPGSGGNGGTGYGAHSSYAPGSEPTPIGPSLIGRREAPGALAGLEHSVNRAPGPNEPSSGHGAAVPQSGRIAYADLAAARVAMQQSASGSSAAEGGAVTGGSFGTTPAGQYPALGSGTHRNGGLGAVRDSILEERARARQRDVEYGLSMDRDNVADFERTVAELDDDPGTELVRRRDNARNLALVGAAAVLAIGLAFGGYLMGRAGRDAVEDDEEDDVRLAPEDEPAAPEPETAEVTDVAPLSALPLPATAEATDSAAPRTGRKGDAAHASAPYKPKPFGPRDPGAIAGPGAGSTARPATAAPPPPDPTPPDPVTAAAGADGHGDLDSFAPYGGGSKDHSPGLDDSGVDEVGIAMVVKHHLPKVRSCLERRLKTDPALSGRVEVQFTIAEDGTVPAAFVTRSTVPDPTVGECIVAEMRTWRFPRPPDGAVNLIYPFVFPPRK